MEYFNNLGQLPLDEPMGYGISYLGIKPTAVGVVPVQPIQVQPIVAPVTPQPINIPKAPTPPAQKPMMQQQPMSITPQPISRPMQQTFTPSPNILKQPVNPAQVAPPAPQITGPITPDFGKSPYSLMQEDYNQMQNVQALPPSLQPISPVEAAQPAKPQFSQLNSFLNKGTQK